MSDVTIRKFKYTDVDDFIRLSNISFAEENVASGITPEDFEHETRRIFRWKMLPYKLLTAMMGIQWEGFVAEKDGKVVGGGMYIGRNNRMSITNLMVDPEYRRQGIGQALLIRRLGRMTERGFPFAMAQVLETNTASLQNLRKQNFEVFNQYSVYEHALPLPDINDSTMPPITVREISRSDRALFKEIEKKTTPQSVLSIKGSIESQYFLSGWQKNICTVCQIFQVDQRSCGVRRKNRFFVRGISGSAAKRVVDSACYCRRLPRFLSCDAQ